MNTALAELATELRTTDRTLRRAVEQSLIRAWRPTPRKVDISISERAYLTAHWRLLSSLRTALRTEPALSLAVLYGSRARGDHRSNSDVDVLVALRQEANLRELASRLSQRLGLDVQLISLNDAERTPLLLAEILRDGRVLIDRGDVWSMLRENQPRIERAAARERRRIDREFEAFLLDRAA